MPLAGAVADESGSTVMQVVAARPDPLPVTGTSVTRPRTVFWGTAPTACSNCDASPRRL